MGLPYLKVQSEEAIQTLDECIVRGYQIKDQITQVYYSDKTQAEQKIPEWQKMANDWANDTIQKLGEVFVSQKELYNFRDAEPPFGATSENVHYVGIVSRLKARVDKLNEYDSYIRNQFNVKVEVVRQSQDAHHWYQTWWGKSLLGLLVAIVAGAILYFVGWN